MHEGGWKGFDGLGQKTKTSALKKKSPPQINKNEFDGYLEMQKNVQAELEIANRKVQVNVQGEE